MQKNYSNLTDEELMIEKKKLKNAKVTHALIIGFLGGIILFGIIGWFMSSEKRLGFFIPMIFPAYFIYRMVKNSEKNQDLEDTLRERGLN